jgi:hypothetical protein
MPRMKPLAPLLAAAILVLCFFSYEQKARIDQQAKAIADLSKEVAENKKTRNSFEYQERCSEQARKSFADLGYKEKKMAGYENHYNETMNKCVIAISDTEPSAGGTFYTSRTVFDAIEGKTYGEYIWQSDKVKKFWEVAPLMCRVTDANGEEHKCKSDDEFKQLLKPYMDIS